MRLGGKCIRGTRTLRHNAATLLRRQFGRLEAAQLTLGHASASITDAVYAERDQAKVMEIMRRIG